MGGPYSQSRQILFRRPVLAELPCLGTLGLLSSKRIAIWVE